MLQTEKPKKKKTKESLRELVEKSLSTTVPTDVATLAISVTSPKAKTPSPLRLSDPAPWHTPQELSILFQTLA